MKTAPVHNHKDFYLISELASILKVSTHTIRNLETEFNIEVKKDLAGKRVYTYSDVEKYRQIIDKKNSFDLENKISQKSAVKITNNPLTNSEINSKTSELKINTNSISESYNNKINFGYNFYSLFSNISFNNLSRYSIATFLIASVASFGSFFLDSKLDISTDLNKYLGVNTEQVSNVLQSTSENWDYRFDVNVPAYFNNSLVGSSASFNLITVGDRVVLTPQGISAPNIINTVRTLPNEQVLVVDATDVNNPILSISNNPTFNTVNAKNLNGITKLDATTINTIESAINIPTANTDATTFGGLAVTDFLRSNTDTVFSNGIMTFDASSSLKFQNLSPSTFLKLDSSNNLTGIQILPGLNVDFTSTPTSLTINLSTNPIATQNYTSLAVNTLFLGTSSFDVSFQVLATASELNKLHTLSGSLITTSNILSLYPNLDTDASNDIITSNLASSILTVFPNIDTNASNDVLTSNLASLMLTNYVNLDTDATNDITTSNFSSTLFSLFPNLDTDASNDIDILQDAVLIGSTAGKNVYSSNIWFGYQDFTSVSAFNYEVEANGKIVFDGGVLPSTTTNSLYNYGSVLYFQDNPLAILKDHTIINQNNRFAFFTTNANGKLQLSGSPYVGLTYFETGPASSILSMDGSSLRYLNVVGDLSISTTSSSNITFKLNDVNSTIGTFGSGNVIPQISVNSKGLVTQITTIPVTIVSNPNNYVTNIDFSTPASAQRALTLQRNGLSSLTASFLLNNNDISTALGFSPFDSANFTASNITNALGYTPLSAVDTFADNAVNTMYSNYYTMYDLETASIKGFIDYDFWKDGSFKFGNSLKIDPIAQSMSSTYSTDEKTFYYNFYNGDSLIFQGSTGFGTTEVIQALGYTPFDSANFTAAYITNALGYIPQANLGYTPLNSTAFNAVNITNALGYVPFGSTSFVAGTNISLSSTATSLTIDSSYVDTTNANNFVSSIDFSDTTSTSKTLTLNRTGLSALTAVFSISASNITSALGYTPFNSASFTGLNIISALGYTPLKNTSDTLSGNLTVTGTLSGNKLFQNGNAVCDTSGNCAGNGGSILGSGNAGYLSLFTASNTIANSSIYQSIANGYIGINTTNPGEQLDIAGAIKLSQDMGTASRNNALYQSNGVLYWNGQVVGVVGSTAPGGISGTKDYIPYFNTKNTLIASDLYYESGSTERSLELVTSLNVPTYVASGHKNQYSFKLGVASDSSGFFTNYDSEDDVVLQSVSNTAQSDLIFALNNHSGKMLFVFDKNASQTAPFAMTYNRANASGSFGINTTNPSFNLDVTGSARITGTLATKFFSNPSTNSFVFLSGANFNGNLSAGSANLTGLTLANALTVGNGGTGLSATPSAGQLLIGNGTGYTLSSLVAGTNVSISTGAGSITISATGTTNANNYVTAISFSDASSTTKTLTLTQLGLENLTASFSLSAANVTSALGYTPFNAASFTSTQIINTLGYTPLNSTAFNAVNITNALGYVPFGSTSFVAGTNISLSSTATSLTIDSTYVDTTNANNYVTAISFSDASSTTKTLTLTQLGLENLTASFSLSAANVTSALGYTPLNKAGDSMSGSLVILNTLSTNTLWIGVGGASVFTSDDHLYVDMMNGVKFRGGGPTTFEILENGNSSIALIDSAGSYIKSNFSAAVGTFTNLTLANALTVGNGGTGLSATPSAGQLLIGNGTGYTLSSLVAGTNVSISTGAGSITISATGTTNANNYVTAISFSDASSTTKTLTLTQLGLENLTATFSISAANVTSALGYTPLKNTTDTLTGNLTVTGTISTTDIYATDNLFISDYLNNGYAQIEPITGTLARKLIIDLNSGTQANSTIGLFLQSVKFSAPASPDNKNLTFNQVSGTNLTLDIVSAGTLPTILNNVLNTYSSTVAVAYFSSPLSNKTFNFLTGTISTSNLNVNGYFSAGSASLGSTYITTLTGTSANFSGNLTAGSLYLAANTTTKTQLRLIPSAGVDINSPSAGDLWFNGTALNFYNGSQTINLLSSPVNYFGSRIYSAASNNLADGGSIQVSHNQNTKDLVASAFTCDGDVASSSTVCTNVTTLNKQTTTIDNFEDYSGYPMIQYYNYQNAIRTGSGGNIYFLDSTSTISNTPQDNAGNNVSYEDGFVVHQFTAAATALNQTFVTAFTLPSSQYLLAGGGGGGGRMAGGGGGGGRVTTLGSSINLSIGTYTLNVGIAGTGQPTVTPAVSAAGGAGGNTTFSGPNIATLTAGGGCGGAGWTTNSVGCTGNGGGQGGSTGVSGTAAGSGLFSGGLRSLNTNGGGGGGMAQAGKNSNATTPGDGGNGINSTLPGTDLDGLPYIFGAGGGAGSGISPINDVYARGGTSAQNDINYYGGGGGSSDGYYIANSGTQGFGGGGGGGAYDRINNIAHAAGSGASGSVYIRYPASYSLKASLDTTTYTEGTSSIKFDAATDSANKTANRYYPAGYRLDFQNRDKVAFFMRATRTGANIQLSYTDDISGTTFSYTPSIATANTWQKFVWDISDVPNIYKSGIGKFTVTVINASAANSFWLDDIKLESVGYTIKTIDNDNVVLYNNSGTYQNMKLVVAVNTASLIEYALGYTPLRNDSDYMRGSLGVTSSFSAASGLFTGNLSMGSAVVSGNLSAATANLTGLLTGTSANFSGNLSAGTAFINGYFSAGNASLGATTLTTLTGTSANFSGNLSAGTAFINGYFSAGSASLGATTLTTLTGTSATFSGNLSAGTAFINGYFSAGSASLGATTLTTLTGTSATFSGNLSAGTAFINGYFSAGSASLGATTLTTLTGTSATFSGNLSAGTAFINGYFSAGNASLGATTLTTLTGTSANFSGNLSAGTAFINGYFSAGNASLATTNLTGVLTGTSANFSGTLSGANASFAAASLTGILNGTTANFSGNVTMASARVVGNLSAATVNLTGLLTGTTATFSGNVSAGSANLSGLLTGTTATFSGNVSAGSANLSGLLTGTTATFSGNVSAGSANLSGLLTGTTATFSGNVSAGSANLSGLLTGTTANFSGNVTMASAVVTGNLSAATVNLTGLLTGTTATFSGNLSAGTAFINGYFSAGNASLGATTLTTLTGTSANFSGNLSAGTAFINGYFSAGNASLGATTLTTLTGTSANFSGNLSAGTAFINGYFSAGNASLATTNLTGVLTGTSANFSGTLSGANASFAAASLTGILNGTTANFSGNVTMASARVVGNLSAATVNLTGLLTGTTATFSGNVSAGSANLSGLLTGTTATFSGNVSAGSANLSGLLTGTTANFSGNVSGASMTFAGAQLLGNLNVSNPSGQTILDLNSSAISGDNGLLRFVQGSTVRGQWALNSNNAFVWTNYAGVTNFNNDSGSAFNWGISGSTRLTLDSSNTITLTGASARMLINGRLVTTSASDRILKAGIEQFSNPLSIIDQLRAVTFNWRESQNSELTIPGRNFGMIAQEVEEVIPNLNIVNLNPDGTKYIKYDVLSALAIEGIKEQQVQISTLSNAIGTMNLTSMQNVYNQFMTTIENLSMSTENGALVVNTALTVTGESLFNDAVFTGNVAIGQIKFDSLTNDISINGMNCTNIDGTLNTNLCETQTLYVMKNKAGNINFFDGKVVINPNGEMTVEKITAGEVAAAKVKASEYEVVAGSEVSGSTQILTGQTELTILTSKVKANSKVFVTANGDLEGKSLYVSDKVEGVSFKVKLNQAVNSDIHFDWFILNTE